MGARECTVCLNSPFNRQAELGLDGAALPESSGTWRHPNLAVDPPWNCLLSCANMVFSVGPVTFKLFVKRNEMKIHTVFRVYRSHFSRFRSSGGRRGFKWITLWTSLSSGAYSLVDASRFGLGHEAKSRHEYPLRTTLAET